MSGSTAVEALLQDAEKLVTRLKAHEGAADILLSHADALNRTIKAKSTYMKEITALNEVARHRPRSELVLDIQLEDQQIRRLQIENRDLRMLIDEHESALDVIMTKYREQTGSIAAAQRSNEAGSLQCTASLDQALHRKRNKCVEVVTVMKQAVNVDEGADEKGTKLVAKLKQENEQMRQILKIRSGTFDALSAASSAAASAVTATAPPAQASSDIVDLSCHKSEALPVMDACETSSEKSSDTVSSPALSIPCYESIAP